MFEHFALDYLILQEHPSTRASRFVHVLVGATLRSAAAIRKISFWKSPSSASMSASSAMRSRMKVLFQPLGGGSGTVLTEAWFSRARISASLKPARRSSMSERSSSRALCRFSTVLGGNSQSAVSVSKVGYLLADLAVVARIPIVRCRFAESPRGVALPIRIRPSL